MSQTNLIPADEQDTSGKTAVIPPYAWVILFAVFVASVAAPLNQNKVPPLMPVLMDAFAINLSEAGLLMSVFSVTGLLLALPAGFITQRFGPKVTGLIAVGSLAVGAIIGAMADSMSLLLVSRVVEGVGMGLIAVVAPAVIALWFPSEKQGMAMGISMLIGGFIDAFVITILLVTAVMKLSDSAIYIALSVCLGFVLLLAGIGIVIVENYGVRRFNSLRG